MFFLITASKSSLNSAASWKNVSDAYNTCKAPPDVSDHMFCVLTVKPVVPKCSVPKSVPFGKSAELSCVEDEGFPKSQYQWFKSREEIPTDPKTSHTFFNSSYLLNAETGTLVSMCACACVWTRTRTSGKGGAAGWVGV